MVPTRLTIYSVPPASTKYARAATCSATSKHRRRHHDSEACPAASPRGSFMPASKRNALCPAAASCARDAIVLRPAAPATQALEGAVTASRGFEAKAIASTCTKVAAAMRMINAVDVRCTSTSQQHHRQVVSSRRTSAPTCWVPLVRLRSARTLSRALICDWPRTAVSHKSRWRSVPVQR